MTEHLCELPIHLFLDRIAASTPAPGGGSVAAAAGAMGAALLEMVASISLPKASDEIRPRLEAIRQQAHELRNELCNLIDHDNLAYLGVVAAYKTPKDQPDRKDKIQEAMWEATDTPLGTLEACKKGVALAGELELIALKTAASDVNVGLSMLQAGAEGARENVLINLPSLKDEAKRAEANRRLGDG